MRTIVWSACSALLLVACQRTPGNNNPTAESANPVQSSHAKAASAQATDPPSVDVGGVAQCEATEGLDAKAAKLVHLADANHDGAMSKKEAQNSARMLVGAFFFRADENGDGKITPEEGKAARKEFKQNHPVVAKLFAEARKETGKSPFAAVARLLDVNYDKTVTAAEARKAAMKTVNALFAFADTNHDQKITVAEARKAGEREAKVLADAAFQKADTNGDHQLSLAEFRAAAAVPLKVVFDLADKNKNGELSKSEAGNALERVIEQIGVSSGSGR